MRRSFSWLQLICAVLPAAILFIFNQIFGDQLIVRSWAYDLLAHIAGGITIAFFGVSCAKNFLDDWWRRTPLFARIIFIIAFVALFGVLWEWYEFLWDTYFGTLMQPSNTDTMIDLGNDLIGAALGAFIFFDL